MTKSKLAQKGFTMIELIFVIAIILSLTAIFAPLAMDKLGQTKSAKAQADIDALAAALANFLSDLGNFPSCSAADCDPNNKQLKFLAVCTGTGGCNAEYPTSATWGDLTTQDEATLGRNNVYNHILVNDPAANGTTDQAGTDYNTAKWKGPYITKLGADPWGKAYVIHVGGMQKGGCPVDTTGAATCGASGRGWILSAGPDGVLDTAPTATTLSGDDLGYIFCSDC